MKYEELVRQFQQYFTDGLVIIIGSGLSAAEGIPGMPELSKYLIDKSNTLTDERQEIWKRIELLLNAGDGLEAALIKEPPSDDLEKWIVEKTVELILPKEKAIISAVLRKTIILRLAALLEKILKPANGLPIITTNYDRLIEVACELTGYHVDTTAVGQFSGIFDYKKSCMGSCRGIVKRSRITILDHFPRAIVLKPHGSLDWYQFGDSVNRCSLEFEAERLIITPGLNKYRAGYNFPFDMHRELANQYINRATNILVIGYGFNDDHLQTHLTKRIREGIPTIILCRTLSGNALSVIKESSNCFGLSKPPLKDGFLLNDKDGETEYDGINLWDIGIFAKEILS